MEITLLVKPLQSGQFEASVLGLPACRVEAESRELAIDGLKGCGDHPGGARCTGG